MTMLEFLAHFEMVRARGNGRRLARCPSHADRWPSLSIRETDDRILIHCFASCSSQDIVMALGLRLHDLFFSRRFSSQAHCERRDRRLIEEKIDQAMGLTIDALREADYLIRSRRALDISIWNPKTLDEELNALAVAYQLLECEAIDG